MYFYQENSNSKLFPYTAPSQVGGGGKISVGGRASWPHAGYGPDYYKTDLFSFNSNLCELIFCKQTSIYKTNIS